MISDKQADSIDTELSFSARVLRDTVDLIKSDLRNLNNSELAPYHPASSQISDTEIQDRYDESNAWRSENSLETVLLSSFSDQVLGSSAKSQFISIAESCGVELEYVDDLITAVPDVLTQYSDSRGDFIYSELTIGGVSVPQVEGTLVSDSLLESQLLTPTVTSHLIVEDPIVLADDDKTVYRNLQKALNYVRQIQR